MGNKKRATCLATLLQNELNSDVAHFTTQIKPDLQQIRLLTGLKVGGKTRNIAIQLVCCSFFRTLTRLFSIIVLILLLLPFSPYLTILSYFLESRLDTIIKTPGLPRHPFLSSLLYKFLGYTCIRSI